MNKWTPFDLDPHSKILIRASPYAEKEIQVLSADGESYLWSTDFSPLVAKCKELYESGEMKEARCPETKYDDMRMELYASKFEEAKLGDGRYSAYQVKGVNGMYFSVDGLYPTLAKSVLDLDIVFREHVLQNVEQKWYEMCVDMTQGNGEDNFEIPIFENYESALVKLDYEKLYQHGSSFYGVTGQKISSLRGGLLESLREEKIWTVPQADEVVWVMESEIYPKEVIVIGIERRTLDSSAVVRYRFDENGMKDTMTLFSVPFLKSCVVFESKTDGITYTMITVEDRRVLFRACDPELIDTSWEVLTALDVWVSARDCLMDTFKALDWQFDHIIWNPQTNMFKGYRHDATWVHEYSSVEDFTNWTKRSIRVYSSGELGSVLNWGSNSLLLFGQTKSDKTTLSI